MSDKAQAKPCKGVIRWAVAMLAAVAMLFWLVWTYPLLRSRVVMSVYSAQQLSASVLKECGMDIRIPIADGWYPRILVFNADGFAAWSGIDARMTVLYTFGAFDIKTRASLLYDPASDKYSAFYGAYAVRKEDGVFGFGEDGALNLGEITQAVRYDDTQLVLASLGCKEPVFEVERTDTMPDAICAGSGGWTRIDAALRVSGTAHAYREDKLAYLQYGAPPPYAGEDFAVTQMSGRVYAKYFSEFDCTVMMYCLAPGMETVDECRRCRKRRFWRYSKSATTWAAMSMSSFAGMSATPGMTRLHRDIGISTFLAGLSAMARAMRGVISPSMPLAAMMPRPPTMTSASRALKQTAFSPVAHS